MNKVKIINKKDLQKQKNEEKKRKNESQLSDLTTREYKKNENRSTSLHY